MSYYFIYRWECGWQISSILAAHNDAFYIVDVIILSANAITEKTQKSAFVIAAISIFINVLILIYIFFPF
ncbi:hypothetical protein SD78_1721 [Bacillus badius]|nr:hypothetical protein SD78_1721 [Bacillus badius]